MSEAVEIRRRLGEKLLNSRQEYNRCYIPKITVKFNEKEAKNKEIEDENRVKEMIKMMRSKWRRSENEETEEKPRKRRKIGSNGEKPGSNGEKIDSISKCDKIPENVPKKCDFSQKNHIYDNDSHSETINGEKPPIASVSFDCGPTNITMGIGVSSIGAGGARAPPRFSKKSQAVPYFVKISALF